MVSPVQSLGAQPQLGVEEDGLLDVGKVQPPAQARGRPLGTQPLGPVDGQDLYPCSSLGAAGVVTAPAALPHPVQMEEEPKEALVPGPSNRRASWEKVRRFSRRFSPQT